LPNWIEFVGKVSSFGARTIIDGLRAPFEGSAILTHIVEVGYKSLPLVAASGFALGTVMTFHTRGTLVTFGARAMIPTVQALAFFVEIGPLVAGFLLAGRVGSGIGAVPANMRVAEQIDAIESLSTDSFKLLVIEAFLEPRAAAHAMSPVAGVGINLAIQDAVAAANILAEPLRAGAVRTADLAKIQRRREFPARVTQRVQATIRQQVGGTIDAAGPRRISWPVRILERTTILRRLRTRFIGIGIRPEHVKTLDIQASNRSVHGS